MQRIISGGQTGADIGGLIAAKEAGLETGGWLPNGFLTEDGPRPDLVQLFGMEEHPKEGSVRYRYVTRTYTNARDSDGTIRFAFNFDSPGEICTKKAIDQYKKPWIDVDVNDPLPHSDVVEWIKENNIKTLNVAGNRESTWPGMKEFVRLYMTKVISILTEN
jgi:hypothetical protein